jgi:hypothetical protein
MYSLFSALPRRQCPLAALEAVKGKLMVWGHIPPLLQIPTTRTITVSIILITGRDKVNKKMKYIKPVYNSSESRLVRRYALIPWTLPPRTSPFSYGRGLVYKLETCHILNPRHSVQIRHFNLNCRRRGEGRISRVLYCLPNILQQWFCRLD